MSSTTESTDRVWVHFGKIHTMSLLSNRECGLKALDRRNKANHQISLVLDDLPSTYADRLIELATQTRTRIWLRVNYANVVECASLILINRITGINRLHAVQ